MHLVAPVGQDAELVRGLHDLQGSERERTQRLEQCDRIGIAAFALGGARTQQDQFGIVRQGLGHATGERIGTGGIADAFEQQRHARQRHGIVRPALREALPHRERGGFIPELSEQFAERGFDRNRLRVTLQEFTVELQRFVFARRGNQAAAEQLHRTHLIGFQRESRAVVFDRLVETALMTRDVAEAEARDALEAGRLAEHGEGGLRLLDLAVFEQHLAEQITRTVQFGRQRQRVARRLLAERTIAAQDQGAGQRELHAGVLRREFGRAAQIGQRLVDFAAIEQQAAEAGDRVRVVLVGAQRGAEQGFRLGQIVVDDGNAREQRMRAGLVGIAPDRVRDQRKIAALVVRDGVAQFVNIELVLDLALFRSPGFTATTLVAMIMFLGMIGFFFVLSLYFGMVQRLDTLGTAWRLLVISGAALIVSGIAGRVMHRLSPRLMITTGLLMVSAAMLTLLGADAGTSFGSLSWRLLLLGLGMGLVTTPMTATAVASVPHPLAGMAAAGNNAFRQVGGALGPAVLGALLTSRAVSSLPGRLAEAGVDGALADQVTAATREAGLGAVGSMALGPRAGQVWGAVGDAFLDGMRLCLIVSAGLTFLAAVLAFALLPAAGRKRSVKVAGEPAARVPGGTERHGVGSGTPA